MLLSKKSTFYLVFSVLLVAALAFAVPQATAAVEVTVKGGPTTPAGGVIVTIAYSVNPNPAPTKATFTDINDAPLASSTVLTKVDDKTFTLTQAAAIGTSLEFRFPGYLEGTAQNITISSTDTMAVTLQYDDANYLRGHGYMVIADNNDALASNVYPSLPATVVAKRAWWQHDGDAATTSTADAALPNLYDLFQLRGGGTINLKVLDPADATATQRLGSKKDDGTYDANHNRNQRQVVINEVMWARDNALVGQTTRTREQWIELRNMKTRPVNFAHLVLSTDKAFPAPAAETDRLSNVPNYNNTWSIAGKGQDGNSGGTVTNGIPQFTKVDFVSMERVNYDNGWDAGRWASAVEYFLPNYKGTPGAENRPSGLQGARTVAAATNPPKNKIIVSEIGLSTTAGHDWIELHNVTDSTQSLKNWTVSLSEGYDKEDVLMRFGEKFPGNHRNAQIEAKGHLLLVFAQPKGTPLSVGYDVALADRDQVFGHEDHKFVFIGGTKNLPDNSHDWLIIVRSNHEDKYLKSSHHIQDVAGPGGNSVAFKVQDINAASPRRDKKGDGNAGGNIWHTAIWPLQNQNLGGDKWLRHTNLPKQDVAWHRRSDKGGGQGWRHESFGNSGYTSLGYDRGADPNKYKGSPGYPNGAHKGKVGDISDGMVVISELMLTTDGGRYPQWLELYNTSKTNAVNLAADDGWRLVIENHDSGQWEGKRDLISTINLKSKDNVKSIPPNQTVLIVSTTTTRASTSSGNSHFPSHRVYDVYTNDRAAFYMANRRAPFLNTNGFHIKLIDGKNTVSDEIGNLDGNNRTYDVPYSWEWPSAMTANEERTSLIRIKDNGTYRQGTPDRDVEGSMMGAVIPMGVKWRGNNDKAGTTGTAAKVWAKYAGHAWVHAADTNMAVNQDTYYGSRDDHGTPGHTSNTPLPVELSHFRPTLENGEVVIRWTTESELDNAGFNILRSDTRTGEYKQVNAQLIQGHGTTGERHTYKWVDASAKQNVVYYYQIEDVSLAGERQTLQTTKLKGLISAVGKATTTWGDIKEVQ